MLNPQTTAIIIGHSYEQLPSQTTIETTKIALNRMITRAKELGYTTFLSGMGLGVGQWGAAMVIDNPELEFVACPTPGQEESWGWTQLKMYQKLLACANEVILINNDFYQWMCEHSSLAIAVWDGSNGKVADTLAYAKAFGLQGMVFNPKAVSYSQL